MPKRISASHTAALIALGLFGVIFSGSMFPSAALAAPPQGFQNQLVVSGLSEPTDMAASPDGRIFVTEKGGKLVIVQNGKLLAEPALNLASTTQGVATGGDRGLLSIALDPHFAQNGYVYLAYTTASSHERISRFTMAGNAIDPASEKILLQNPAQWSGFLNAVTLRYNPADGKLYATFGSDGVGSNAQDLSQLSGKVLRINLDGSIPSDNPYADVEGAQGAIWAIGFRNPWKMNIAKDGSIWVGDVGENTWEEVDHVFKGENYGWPMEEGTMCTEAGHCAGLALPTYEYNHDGKSAAIMGGDFYQDGNFPAPYKYDYFFGDYIQGWIDTLELNSGGQVIATSTFDTGLGHLSAINYEPDGCLYYLVISPGSMGRFCYTGSGSGSSVPPSGQVASVAQHAPGSTLYATTTVISKVALQNIIVDEELWASVDGEPVQVGQTFKTGVNIAAGQSVEIPWSLPNYPGATIKVGVFSSDWSTLYDWNDDAGTVEGGEFGQLYASGASVNQASAAPSQSIVITTTASATQNNSNLLLDTEVDTQGGGKVTQKFEPISLEGSVATSTTWRLEVPSVPGTYVVKVGLFSSNWRELYRWNNAAAQFSVAPSSTPQSSFVISASLPAASLEPDSTTTLAIDVTATANIPDAVVDTEIYDSSGAQVFQHAAVENLKAGSTASSSTSLIVPSVPGRYTVKVGVFSAGWGALLNWQDRVLTFYSGLPPQRPAPGQTYSIEIEAPQNGASVSGTMEVKALIPSLDIDSYDLWWKTGDGPLKNLDTDPITQNFKHAWINFDAWNWSSSHQYPVTFVATDLDGTEIGSTTITVIHQ